GLRPRARADLLPSPPRPRPLRGAGAGPGEQPGRRGARAGKGRCGAPRPGSPAPAPPRLRPLRHAHSGDRRNHSSKVGPRTPRPVPAWLPHRGAVELRSSDQRPPGLQPARLGSRAIERAPSWPLGNLALRSLKLN
ncbi:hypothetical protein MC885_002859, partial [Smutsia gigantea]